MASLDKLSKYTIVKRFTLCNEDKTLILTFHDAATAEAYSELVNYDRLSNQLVEIKLSNFRLKKLWQVERTIRCITDYNKKAMTKLKHRKDL